MEAIHEFIGLTAALLTTISFMPQVFRTWKTRSSNGLSWAMLIISLIAATLWFSYGIHLKSNIIVLSNAIMGALQLVLIYFKIRYHVSSKSNLSFSHK
ncbi:SemiSWEET family sugar transporter [Fulvivirga sediminis]|uniref:Sugar transporter SemiSWEET n=1 Tax=Fulvivirga sediminis TaxID=2803949 RepID=A0A937F9F7_9BACT|nr:SemiSWEET family transporter [Fulvivirga sediminis]MBL3657676.1 hypothetical protein [Fulvivirga sediminis]